jgi:CheY-like chemotaxis protein
MKKHLNIFLADDDIDDFIFFKEALEGLELSTNLTVAHDGEQLMQLLTDQTIQFPDVLFLDLNMPRKNGFECLAEIKSNEKLKQLPVIIFSTSFEEEVVNSLYKSGAQYFIQKPPRFAQFKKVIQQTIVRIAQKNGPLPTKENFVLTVENNLAA